MSKSPQQFFNQEEIEPSPTENPMTLANLANEDRKEFETSVNSAKNIMDSEEPVAAVEKERFRDTLTAKLGAVALAGIVALGVYKVGEAQQDAWSDQRDKVENSVPHQEL